MKRTVQVLIAALTAVIVASGLTFTIQQPKPTETEQSKISETQTPTETPEETVSTNETKTPVENVSFSPPLYPGAMEIPLEEKLWSHLNVPEELSKSNYVAKATVSEVLEWYKDQLSEWSIELLNESICFNGVEVGFAVFRRNELGLMVIAGSSSEMPDLVLIGIANGPWNLVKEVKFTPPTLTTPTPTPVHEEEVDWSDAKVFTDPVGDFWLGEGSPPEVIPFPPCDIVKVYVKEDGTWLYFRFDLNGEIPALPLNYENDTVVHITWVVVIDKDWDLSTGDMGGYKGSDILISFSLDEWNRLGGYYFFYDPNGWEGCDRLDPNTGKPIGDLSDREVIVVGGGIGKNYIAFKLPLQNLGIKKDDRIRIATWVEAESTKYHHFARDEAPTQNTWYEFKITHEINPP